MPWSESHIETVLAKLEADFRNTPHKFFTEHDIHSHLYRLVEDELEKQGKRLIRSGDGQTTSLAHLEYPTPFRCDMNKYDFRVVSDGERTPRGRLYRRGHYDLVVLNPVFVRSYDLVTVSGKNYGKFCSVRDGINVTPLLWVCEILFGAHVEDDLPKNWMKLVEQDSKKVVETLNYKMGKGVDFASYGSVLVFLGVASTKTEKLEEDIEKFGLSQGIKIRFCCP